MQIKYKMLFLRVKLAEILIIVLIVIPNVHGGKIERTGGKKREEPSALT